MTERTGIRVPEAPAQGGRDAGEPRQWVSARQFRHWRRNRGGSGTVVPILCGTVVAVAVVGAVAAPWLTPHDPTVGLLENRLLPPAWSHGGDAEFLLGTDPNGRDVLTRLLYGARITLFVGTTSVLLGGAVGLLLGLLAGFFGGVIDRVIVLVADIQLAFPFLALAVALVSVLGTGVDSVILVLSLSGWVLYALIIRGEVLRLRGSEFVLAGRVLGASNWRLLFSTILPNVWAPAIVIATSTFAHIIIIEASLSFLGVGIQPPQPTWGGMLSTAANYLGVSWWLTAFPGGALLVLVLAVNALGDWLRDVLDPLLEGPLTFQ